MGVVECCGLQTFDFPWGQTAHTLAPGVARRVIRRMEAVEAHIVLEMSVCGIAPVFPFETQTADANLKII